MAAPQRKYTHVTDARVEADARRCRRAPIRDLLTGAPIASGSIVRRVKVDDYPSPRQEGHVVQYGATHRNKRVVTELPIIAYIDADTLEEDGDADDE